MADNHADESHTEQVLVYLRNLQETICTALADVDGRTGFREDNWEREGGGGACGRLPEKG